MKALIRSCGREFLRTGWPWLLFATSFFLLAPSVFRAAATYIMSRLGTPVVTPVEASQPQFLDADLVRTLVLAIAMTYGGLPFQVSVRALKQRRTLPVSDTDMTRWHLLLVLGTTFGMAVFVTLAYRFLYEVQLPVLGIACWSTSLVGMGFSSLFWLRDCRWFRFLFVVGLWAAIFFWLEHRFDSFDGRWRTSEWTDPVFLIFSVTLTWWMTLSEYRRFRHGEPIRGWFLTFLLDPSDLEARLTEKQTGLSNPDSAIHWLDQNRLRLVRLVLTGLMTIGAVLLCVSVAANPKDGGLMNTFWVLSLLAASLSAAIAGLLGFDNNDPPKKTMKHLVATLPISDRQMAELMRHSIFRTTTSSVLIAVAVFLTSVILASLGPRSVEQVLTIDWQHPVLGGFGKAGLWIPIVITIGLSWLMAGLCYTSALASPWNPVRTLAVFYGTLLSIFFAGLTPPGSLWNQGAWGFLIAVLAFFSGWNFRALWLSVRKNLTEAPSAIRVAVVALLLAVAVAYWMPLRGLGIILGLAVTLIAVPYGALPLAVQACRHR